MRGILESSDSKFKFYNKGKKAQGLSTNTIILLILGLIVLGALIYGFYTGWAGLKNTIEKNNVGDVVVQCQSACSMNSKYDFCVAPKRLVDADNKVTEASCKVLATEPSMKQYGIEDCSSVICQNYCTSLKVNDKPGVISDEGITDYSYDITDAVSDVPSGSKCLIL